MHMTSLAVVYAHNSTSVAYVMVVLGFTAVGTGLLTALAGWMRRRAAVAMDGVTPQLGDSQLGDYASRRKSAFIKSSKTNVLYYIALGEAILGVTLLLIGWIASIEK
jgi:low temperature requirement protein LtrA